MSSFHEARIALRQNEPAFAILLRQHRRATGYSQESLAERAGLSVGAIAALEQGRRRAPYRDTVRAIAKALALSGSLFYEFEEAAARERGRQRHDTSNLPASSSTLAERRQPGEPRAMFAHDRSRVSVDSSSAGRHAAWVGAVADAADAKYLRVPHGTWMREVAPWLEDARIAVSWALGDGGDPVLAGRILGGLRGVWRTSGLAAECRQWVDAVLPLINAREHPGLVSRLYRALAQSSTGVKRVEAALRAQKLAEYAGERVAISASLTMLTEGLYEVGHYARALETVNENARLIEREGLCDTLLYARTFYDRSLIFRAFGESDRILPELEAALRIARVTGDEWVSLDCQTISAECAFDSGAPKLAIARAEEILREANALGWDVFSVSSLNSIATYQLAIERTDDALAAAVRALALSRGRDAFGFDVAIQHLAAVAARRGRHSQAAILHGFVEASFDQKAYVQPERDQALQNSLLADLRRELDPEEFRALARVGQALTEDVVADLAMTAAAT
jgi:transcriptional regulator with XRE-family HTH domain